MKSNFYNYQIEVTLNNLADENKRLKNDIIKLNREVARNQDILDFHDKLEKDFFSADSLEDLTIKLINCLQLMLINVHFVSLCLSKQYMESMLGNNVYEQILPDFGVTKRSGYLSIIDENEFDKYLGRIERTTFNKNPKGTDDFFFPDHGEEVKSQAIVPLILRGRAIGCLNIGSIFSKHSYNTEMGLALLDRLSAKLAIAVDNILSHKKLTFQKELLDRDIDAAAILQKSLLPAVSLDNGLLEISSCFFPCQKLGGDFFDIITLSREKTAVIVADVAGHGISASLIAAMLKFSLQMDNIKDLSPAEIISNINEKFCQILKHEDYITLCYGLIDTKHSTMNLVRAGHPYPILFSASGKETSELKPSGPPVGVDREASFENMEVKLGSGDVIIFYTDGLVDALFDREKAHEFEQFELFLRQRLEKTSSIQEFVSRIEKGIKIEELEDDVSLFSVMVK